MIALLSLLASENAFDAEFWTKVILCCAAIVVAIPILIFVKPKDKNLSRALGKRLTEFNKQLKKTVDSKADGERGGFTKKSYLSLTATLNACHKLSQQAAYENDNVAMDTVKTKLGDARAFLSELKFSKESGSGEYLNALSDILCKTDSAEQLLGGVLENERKFREKKAKRS